MHPDRFELPLCGTFRIDGPADLALARRFDELIRSNADAFERERPAAHVTASALVVDASGSAAVLTHHAKLGRWLQPGGHCDGIEDPFFVAQKEAYEETGLRRLRPVFRDVLDLDIHAIPARGDEPEHLHYDVRYALRADARTELRISSESIDLRWVPLDELERWTDDESVLRLRTRFARLGYAGSL